MNARPEYTLFCAPNSYAMGVHAILEETGAEYDLRWVTLFSETPEVDFLAASPHARVPALLGPEGTLFESGAIAMYLAERHPEAELSIEPGHPLRGPYLQWIHYLAATLQPDVMLQFHPELYFSNKADQAALKQASMQRLDKVLRVIDTALSPGPWFLGETLSVADFCFGMQAIWPEIYPSSISAYPNITQMVERLLARTSARKVTEIHLAASKQ